MSNSYEVALQILDDLDAVSESSFGDLGPRQSRTKNVVNKFGKMCSKIADGLVRIVTTLIGWIQQISILIIGKIRGLPRTAIIVDRYGYVDVICKASTIIDEYYNCLINLYELDAEINKAMSVMDDVKDKLSNSTIRFIKNDESKLQQEIKVKKNFDIINQCDSELESLLDNVIKNPVEVIRPKKYTIESLEKVMNHNLNSKKKQLQELKYTLEIAKRVYDDRSWVYKKIHSQDISRNRDMLNCTSALLSKIEEYKTLYVKLVAQFD